MIVVTAYGDEGSAVEGTRLGAAYFFEKGGEAGELKLRIAKALAQVRVARRLRQLEEELSIVEPRQIVGGSDRIREVNELITTVARDSCSSVPITGETGTGKELVARAIHASGLRADHAFVPVVIAALAPSIVESGLFGHDAGGFTGARGRVAGLWVFGRRSHFPAARPL